MKMTEIWGLVAVDGASMPFVFGVLALLKKKRKTKNEKRKNEKN
jgi:hypothetical protein